eukprot:4776850-Amphidinium_carterae.1
MSNLLSAEQCSTLRRAFLIEEKPVRHMMRSSSSKKKQKKKSKTEEQVYWTSSTPICKEHLYVEMQNTFD